MFSCSERPNVVFQKDALTPEEEARQAMPPPPARPAAGKAASETAATKGATQVMSTLQSLNSSITFRMHSHLIAATCSLTACYNLGCIWG